MPKVPGLASPHVTTSGLVYFARMLSKIRLHAKGELPQDYVPFIGAQPGMFDGRCLLFLRLDYDELVERTLAGGTDEEILQWAYENGRQPSNEEIEVWNGFMTKRGWRDSGTVRLAQRCADAGFGPERNIQTMFEFIDADEA